LSSGEISRLYSYTLNQTISVREALLTPDISDMFHRPLSVQATMELVELQRFMQDVVFNQMEKMSGELFGKMAIILLNVFIATTSAILIVVRYITGFGAVNVCRNLKCLPGC
jgi:hypothetical protein